MSDTSRVIGGAVALWLAFIFGGACGDCTGQQSGRDAMCAATCADAAGWSRTGTDCTCLDPVERPARRSRP